MSFAFDELNNLEDETNQKATLVVNRGLFEEHLSEKAQSAVESPELSANVDPSRLETADPRLQNFGQTANQVPSRRRGKKVFLIVSGIVLGVFASSFFLETTPVKKKAVKKPAEVAAPAFESTVEKSQPTAKAAIAADATVDSQGIAEEGQAVTTQRVTLSDNTPQSIENFIESREIKTAPRKFLFDSESKRVYGTDFMQPETPKNEMSDFELRAAKKGKRLNPTTGGMQWQGGWKLNDPAENIKLSDSYKKYLDEFSSGDGSRFKQLEVIQQNRPLYPRPDKVVPQR